MRHWYQEIHRRGLWQAAAGFLAAAWVVIEVVDLLTGRGLLPDWVFNGALVLLAIGFPVILATAWVQTPPAESATKSDHRVDPGESRAPATRPTDAASTESDAGLKGLLTWRNALIGGVAAFALLGAGTAATSVLRIVGLTEGNADQLDADRVAVLPFEVRGSPEFAYLGEGLMDLVSAKLDGAGNLKAADPRAVIGLSASHGGDPSAPPDARAIASELGAGRYVTGDLLEVGGRIRLTAFLHRTDEPSADFQEADIEGSPEELFELLDVLVADLLAGSLSAEGDRLKATAALTSGSMDATKAYLEGERLMRMGRYRESADAYDRAIAIDSAFALAYYRRSVAADWIDAPDIRSSADRAFEYSDRLSARDRGLLNGLRLRRNGRVVEAEQAFRAQLHVFPDDVEALVQFGEVLFHDHHRRGRSMMESLGPFERALELEPTNLIALTHLARLYAISDSIEQLESTTRRISGIAPESERALELEALHAYTIQDTVRQRELQADFAGRPWYHRVYAVLGVDRFGRDAAGALKLIEQGDTESPLLESLAPLLLVEQGRRQEALSFLEESRLREVPWWKVLEAFVLTSGLVSVGDGQLSTLARELEELEPEEMLQTMFLPPYEDITPRFISFLRDYYAALLWIESGNIERAEAIIVAMRAQDDFPGMGTVKPDSEKILEAEIMLKMGDREGGLEVLRSVEYQVPHAVTVTPLADQSRSRLLRSRLELETGNLDAARSWLAGLDESWSPWDGMFRGEVYELLGRIAEQQGRSRDAIVQYTRLLELWNEADPDLLPVRGEIEMRRNALVRDQG